MVKKRVRGFESVKEECMKGSPNFFLPKRGTKHSAGYDVYNPGKTQVIPPNEVAIIWTNIKAYMQEGEVLLVLPRSSMGIKRGLMLANTVGVIDKDYYGNPDNDGNIAIAVRNLGTKPLVIEHGERFAQFIFMPFLESDNGNSDKERLSGVGSTGTK